MTDRVRQDDDTTQSLSVHVPVPPGPGRRTPPTVHVRVWPADGDGEGARRPLLLALHGWTDSGEVFGSLARALGYRWTVVAPDAPGHGRTPWPAAERYDVPTHADTVAAVLDTLPEVAGRRRRVVVLGHSLGAVTAAHVAALRPRGVAHLVLEDPARTTMRPTRSVTAMRTWMRGLQATDHTGRVAYLLTENPDWPPDERDAWARSKAEVDLAHLSVPITWGEPLVALLSEVRCPVTIVRGQPGRGGIVSMTGAKRCAAACRAGCEVVALDAGHNPRREAREPFVAVLASVLGRYDL